VAVGRVATALDRAGPDPADPGVTDLGATARAVRVRRPDTDPIDVPGVPVGVALQVTNRPGRQAHRLMATGGRGLPARGGSTTIAHRVRGAGETGPRDLKERRMDDRPDRAHRDRARRDRDRWIATFAHTDRGRGGTTLRVVIGRARLTVDRRTPATATLTGARRTDVRRTAVIGIRLDRPVVSVRPPRGTGHLPSRHPMRSARTRR
jgi:hypothetical protein